MLSCLAILYSCKNDNPVPEVFKLPSQIINRIVIDNKGVKWIATEKGVVSFDGTKWTAYSDSKSLSIGSVTDLVLEPVSGINSVWLATKVGLSFFDLATNPISFKNFNKKETGILSDTVLSLGIDKSNIKYLGTAKGLSILNGTKWDQFFGRLGEEILAKYKISAIAIASSGSVYVSTRGGGISRFHYADAVSGATTLNLPWAGGLNSDVVFTVMIVNGTQQWYGTDSGVAFHTSEFTKSDWTSYSRADGLVCDTVYSIAKDQSGTMWFGTHRGVSKFNGTVWVNFTTKNGLVANKVNTIAVDLDGSVWFGTDNGISHFITDKWVNY